MYLKKKPFGISLMTVLCLALFSGTAMATNGMNMIGYGPRSTGMGGAEVAVGADSSASAGNPAGMGISSPRSASIGLSVLAPHLSLSDSRNDTDGEDQFFPLPQMSFAQPLSDGSSLIWGLNLYAQGGMGVDFRNIETFAGTKDSLSSQVNYVRLAAALNYLVNDRLSMGMAVLAGYAEMNFSLFPNSYSVGQDGQAGTGDDFAGVDASGLSSFGLAARVGFQYQLNHMLRLGLQYTSEAVLDPKDGQLSLNFGAMNVDYDAEVEGFTWPRELEAGIAVQATPQLLLAADLKWLNWSSAIDTVVVNGTNPSQAGMPSSPSLLFNMNWQDQWVVALGCEYLVNSVHTLRMGYNYGKNPVPNSNLSPLFPATVEHHVTLGYSYLYNSYRFDFAYEHGFGEEWTNNSYGPPVDPNGVANPFGPGVAVTHSQDVVHLQLSYLF
jgi:long-chain fatty acid transport protein